MLFSPRISTKALAALCRRLGMSLQAGIDVRTVWTRETQQAHGPIARSRFRQIREAVNEGESLCEAIDRTGDYFPETFRALARIGEETGHLAETFSQLADHYEEQLKLRRILVSASTWPMIELGLALFVIGFLIGFMGVVNRGSAEPIDPLGFGLVGAGGVAVYVTYLAIIAAGIVAVVYAIRRGVVWTRPIQRLLLRVPVLGKPLECVALSRLSWAMHLTLETGMELRRALRLSLESARNAQYTDHVASIDARVEAGDTIYEAFLATGAFPHHFLDSMRVGEQSGRLAESMELLSRQYREQAEAGFKALTVAGGFGIWLIVAAIIILFIFRLAMFYIGTISSFAQ